MIDPPQFKTLEEVEATKHFNKFKSDTLQKYESRIRSMDDSDLRNHASLVGLKPSTERRQTIMSLVAAYRTAKGNVDRYTNPPKTPAPQAIGRHDSYESFMAAYRELQK